jgi:hypothetical protein
MKAGNYGRNEVKAKGKHVEKSTAVHPAVSPEFSLGRDSDLKV